MMNSDSTRVVRALIRQGVRLTCDAQSSQLLLQLGDYLLDDAQQQIIRDNKADILHWLAHDKVSCLSPQQQRLWFLADIGQSQHYHVSTIAKVVNGSLDTNRLQPALVSLAQHHESLRLRIPVLDDTPYLRITPAHCVASSALAPTIHYIDIHDQPDLNAEQLIEHPQVIASLNRAFSLEEGPLWRCICVQHNHEVKVLILSLHHIICDAWSMQTALDQLNQQCCVEPSNTTKATTELAISPWQYSGYAAWQQQKQQRNQEVKAAKAFWLQQVIGATPLQLPQAKSTPTPDQTTANARILQTLLTSDEFSVLKEAAQQHKTTPFVLYLAGVLLTFAPMTQQQDFSVGMPSANRKEQSWQEVFGFFVNTLLLRLRGTAQQSIAELITDLTEQLQHSQSFQDFPIETLLPEWRKTQHTNSTTPTGQTPLFNVLVNYTPPIPKVIELANAQLQPMLPSSGFAKFELTLSFIEFSNETTSHLPAANHAALVFEFDSARYSTQQVSHWAQQLKQNLLHLTECQAQQLSTFNFPTHSQIQRSPTQTTRKTPTPHNVADIQPLLADLLSIWRQVFENDTIEPSDDFFSLGGHSLLAVTLAKRINQTLAFAKPLSTLELLQHPNVEQLATLLYQRQQSPQQLTYLKTLATGELTLLFPGLPGSLAGYQSLANRLTQQHASCSVLGVSYPGIENSEAIPKTLNDFIDSLCNHINANIQALHPQKVTVIAHSFGATVALACVSKLCKPIAQLTILDAAPHQPNHWQHIAKLNGATADQKTKHTIEVTQFKQFLAMRFSERELISDAQQTLVACMDKLAADVSSEQLSIIQHEWQAIQQLLNFDFTALLTESTPHFAATHLGQNTRLVIAEDSQNWLHHAAWERFLHIETVDIVQGDHFSVLAHISV